MSAPAPDGQPPADHRIVDAGRLIMGLFLASLAMGLGAILVFYFVMRAQAEVWPPPGTPRLPTALWLSTALIIASSGTMHWAIHSVRRDRQRTLRFALLATLLLALGFVASQILNWLLAIAARMPPGLNMFAVTFYLLTGLHGLHVVGGLVPLGIVTARSYAGRYTRDDHRGVTYCAWYWHFVDVVWLIMFAALLSTA